MNLSNMGAMEVNAARVRREMNEKGNYYTDIPCDMCTRRLTKQQVDYCMNNTLKFKGKKYCRFCQRLQA